MFDAKKFFHAVITQDAEALRFFFHSNAWIEWICTNEHFSVEEYIRANCEYPGNWCGAIEKYVSMEAEQILVSKVWPKDESASFHAVSFIKVTDGKIAAMTEYWADDGSAPEWRREMNIGRPIEI